MAARGSCTMFNIDAKKGNAWCTVVADDDGPPRWQSSQKVTGPALRLRGA
jgi:hypothetical protein